jgi:hypothetical protein
LPSPQDTTRNSPILLSRAHPFVTALLSDLNGPSQRQRVVLRGPPYPNWLQSHVAQVGPGYELAGEGAPARQDVQAAEEKITIGESRHDPREQTGEAGDRRFSVTRGAGRATEDLLEFERPVKLDSSGHEGRLSRTLVVAAMGRARLGAKTSIQAIVVYPARGDTPEVAYVYIREEVPRTQGARVAAPIHVVRCARLPKLVRFVEVAGRAAPGPQLRFV